jgi:hypothetical protein
MEALELNLCTDVSAGTANFCICQNVLDGGLMSALERHGQKNPRVSWGKARGKELHMVRKAGLLESRLGCIRSVR